LFQHPPNLGTKLGTFRFSWNKSPNPPRQRREKKSYNTLVLNVKLWYTIVSGESNSWATLFSVPRWRGIRFYL